MESFLGKVNKEMRKAIVLDLDGVILRTEPIFKEILMQDLTGDAKWDYFCANCNREDIEVIEGFKEFYKVLINALPLAIIISTARNEKCRQSTVEKLLKEHIIFDHLYMRKDGDYRSSAEVKEEHLKEIMESYEVAAFVDDDLSNCEMARRLGIFAIRKV